MPLISESGIKRVVFLHLRCVLGGGVPASTGHLSGRPFWCLEPRTVILATWKGGHIPHLVNDAPHLLLGGPLLSRDL